jgi:hypothetical protein
MGNAVKDAAERRANERSDGVLRLLLRDGGRQLLLRYDVRQRRGLCEAEDER